MSKSAGKEEENGLQEAPERTFPVFFRGKLGEKLHQETPGFDLLDPNMRVIDVSYNCLHDKHLKSFFRHPERKKRLVKQGLITSNEKVLCTCKEYNRYSSYIKSVQLLWEKQCCAQQKMLLKQFLVLQQQGEVPSHISLTDIRDWLIAKGRNYFKNTFQSEMEEGKNLHLAELAWDVKRRLRLKELEREVCRELRLERRIRWSVIGQPGSQMGDWRPLGMETHTPLGMDSPFRHSTSSMDTLSRHISTENLEVARLHTARPHIARPQTTRPRSARPPTERPSSDSDHSGTLSSVMTCSPHSASPSVLLAILKPSVSNPYDRETSDLEDSCSNDLEDAESEGVHYATGRKSNMSIVLTDTTNQPEMYIAVDSPPMIKFSKMRKGIRDFFWGVQKAWKRLVTCKSSGSSDG